MKAIYRITLFVVIISTYFIFVAPLYFFIGKYPHKIRMFLAKIVQLYSRVFLRVFKVRVEKKIVGKELANNNYFYVSNHMSYVDILILSSLYPTSFITSIEMKKTPFLGQITTLGGCLFVERRSRNNLGTEIDQIKEALENGVNVTIFPEAKSTNGDEVIRFRKPLFEASISSKIDACPLTINYKTVNGEAVTLDTRDLVCWYGDTPFLGHLIKFASLKELIVEVVQECPISDVGSMSCEELANLSHQFVSRHYVPFPG